MLSPIAFVAALCEHGSATNKEEEEKKQSQNNHNKPNERIEEAEQKKSWRLGIVTTTILFIILDFISFASTKRDNATHLPKAAENAV